jgi:hypothetical protein
MKLIQVSLFSIVTSKTVIFYSEFLKTHNLSCLYIVEERIETSKYVIGMLIFGILPVFFAVLVLCLWTFMRLIKPLKFKENYLRNSLTTSLVIIFLLYPTITKYAFSIFNCFEVDGISYLTKDYNIKCWSENHTLIIIYYTLPIIIVWVFGFPLAIFIILFRNRKKLSE